MQTAINLVMVACLLFAGWAARGWRDDSLRLAEERMLTQARDAFITANAEAIAKIKVTNTTYRQTLQKEIHEKPVYRDCRHDDVGLRVINAALTEPESGGELPAAGAAE